MTKAEQCVCCVKVRTLNSDNIWSHFQPSHYFKAEVLKQARKMVCDHCQKKYGRNAEKAVAIN